MNNDSGYAPDVYNDNPTLSYDDTTSYEDQISETNEADRALANRIGRTKVYLLSESRSAGGKRKRGESEEVEGAGEETEEDTPMDEDSPYRANALLFYGTPISHLPTARLFAYATHFDAHPMGLEWIDDNTCVFVFTSKNVAQMAYRYLQKSPTENEDEDGYVTAKPIPVALWPPEERISNSLGKAEGLKGVIKMRWARHEDVKKKGAKKESEFYRKHGTSAGKGLHGVKSQQDREQDAKRKRRDHAANGEIDEAAERAKLDDDLDRFLAADSDPEDGEPEEELPEEPPSKMRSDYIAQDGRTLLERTSVIRLQPDTLVSRITAPLPKRRKDRAVVWETNKADLEWGRDREHSEHRPRGGRNRGKERKPRAEESRKRPRKSQQELDDELDAFLNETRD